MHTYTVNIITILIIIKISYLLKSRKEEVWVVIVDDVTQDAYTNTKESRWKVVRKEGRKAIGMKLPEFKTAEHAGRSFGLKGLRFGAQFNALGVRVTIIMTII
jgi:hypothetical protein